MHPEEKMNFTERCKYLAVMYRRYQKASPRERSALPDEMEAVTDLHRKSLIRLMQGPVPLERKPHQNERDPVYGPEVRAAVSLIAQALDYPSAERLQPVWVPMASLLAQHGLLSADDALLAQLGGISVSTVRRILEGASRDKLRPVARTRRGCWGRVCLYQRDWPKITDALIAGSGSRPGRSSGLPRPVGLRGFWGD